MDNWILILIILMLVNIAWLLFRVKALEAKAETILEEVRWNRKSAMITAALSREPHIIED